MKIVKLFFIVLLNCCLTTSLYAEQSNEDQCQQAIQNLYSANPDLLAVIKMHTKQPYVYSTTIYNSTDCRKYVKKFTVKNPDVLKGKNALCAILPAGEIDPSLQCIKAELCVAPDDCVSVFIKLSRDQSGKYIEANPKLAEIHF